jgi:hypothetical protein
MGGGAGRGGAGRQGGRSCVAEAACATPQVRGRADVSITAAAVQLVVQQLLPRSPRLWALHGERWAEPQHYSLLLQPFLMSPSINASDFAVALKAAPAGTSVEEVLRRAHPFPILERFLSQPLVPEGGGVAVPARTQVGKGGRRASAP